MDNKKIIRYIAIISCGSLIVLFTSIFFHKINSAPTIDKENDFKNDVKDNLSPDDIMDILNKKMIELEISSMELDEKNNKVIVYLEDLSKEKMDKIRNVVDSPTIIFKKQQGKITLT